MNNDLSVDAALIGAMSQTFVAILRPIVFSLAMVTLPLLGGCQAPSPKIDPSQEIAWALDLSEPIAFRTEGGPVDEPSANVEMLTLAEALHRAVTTDPAMQAALARVRIALADSRQARVWPHPVLNLALHWPQGGGSPIVEASLAQDLIAILQSPRKSSAADNRLRQAAGDAVTVALDAAAEVQERYATVQALDELTPVLQERRALVNRLVEIATARLNAGEGTREDVTVLDAQRVELDVEIAINQQGQRDERLRLARLIGEPSSAATWALSPWSDPGRTEASESQWIDLAMAHRPEIQSIAWQLAALGDEMALARLLPWDGASAGVDAERDSKWSVGPAFSAPLPVFDMGQARRDRVTAEQIEARHELTLAKRRVVEDVRRAYEALEGASANLRRVRDELIPLQEQRRSMAEARFRQERDITGLILAEQDVRSARAKAVDLERQSTIALVRLRRAVGGAGVMRRLPGELPSAPASAGRHDRDGDLEPAVNRKETGNSRSSISNSAAAAQR